MMSAELTPASLKVGPQQADRELAQLDSTDPSHRAVAIAALEALIRDYILPAMDLPLAQTRFDTFDLNAVAGENVPGLVRSLFDEEMPDGLAQPDDGQLKKALDYIGLEALDEDGRKRFLRCWTANRASRTVHALLNFLRKPLYGDVPPQLKQAARAEAARLDALLEHDLPEEIGYLLNTTTEKLKQLSAAS